MIQLLLSHLIHNTNHLSPTSTSIESDQNDYDEDLILANQMKGCALICELLNDVNVDCLTPILVSGFLFLENGKIDFVIPYPSHIHPISHIPYPSHIHPSNHPISIPYPYPISIPSSQFCLVCIIS